MTEIAFTANYVTQEQLARAWRALGHTSKTPPWSATLLIDEGLAMRWACPILADPEFRDEDAPARHTWFVIAEAGELDWPPLRPEAEIWPILLERHPIPTGEAAEFAARGAGGVEAMHRDQLRHHYLDDAHIGGHKRNKSDINFDPAVRDWDVTARELAAFIDAHRPPKLTTDQRVMTQGVALAQLQAQVASTKVSLARLMRNAAREQGPKPRSGFKADLSRWSGTSRPTVDQWLADAGCCEGAVPDEGGTTHVGHTHTHES